MYQINNQYMLKVEMGQIKLDKGAILENKK